jgi:hypothetical protein
MANILTAIKNIIDKPVVKVKEYSKSRIRINMVGDALEEYIKDVFADSFDDIEKERMIKFSKIFSLLGNQNHPPDIILRNGDAIEIKKIEKPNNPLALNSSYPKSKLFKDNPMLTKACRTCETWTIKDIIYIIGCTDDNDIQYLWFVYGDCFVADKEIYERIIEKISTGVTSIPGVEFSKTKELGKVKKIDPLGVTDLRVRGMWNIENPQKIFEYLNFNDIRAKYQLNCLMRTDKFNAFPINDRNALIELEKKDYSIADVKIKEPDNPANLIDAKLITYKLY